MQEIFPHFVILCGDLIVNLFLYDFRVAEAQFFVLLWFSTWN